MAAISSIILGGAAILGAGASIISGNKAAKAQTKAADQATAEQRRQYDLSRADLAPWRETGGAALSSLARLYGLQGPAGATAGAGGGAGAEDDRYGGFFASPGYQFRLDEGRRALERSASARGLLRSGASAKAIQRYGEGLAASEYDAYAGRLAGLAGVGQSAATTTGAFGATAANNISQNMLASGNARASSYLNTGSAINSGINNVLTAYLYNKGGGFGG